MWWSLSENMECNYNFINVYIYICIIYIIFISLFRFTLRGHGDVIIAIRLTKDDKYLATASKDNTIRIWNFDSGTPYGVCIGHTNSMNAIKVYILLLFIHFFYFISLLKIIVYYQLVMMVLVNFGQFIHWIKIKVIKLMINGIV